MFLRISAATIAMVAMVLLALACGTPPAEDSVQATARRHGIEVLGVQLLAGGDLAKLSYRVVDFEKAKEALRGEVRLLAEAGARPLEVMSLARLGPMKQRPSPTGARQFMLFTNPGRVLRKGGTVALAIGKERIAGIPVS